LTNLPLHLQQLGDQGVNLMLVAGCQSKQVLELQELGAHSRKQQQMAGLVSSHPGLHHITGRGHSRQQGKRVVQRGRLTPQCLSLPTMLCSGRQAPLRHSMASRMNRGM
jgi:hypothetical protein